MFLVPCHPYFRFSCINRKLLDAIDVGQKELDHLKSGARKEDYKGKTIVGPPNNEYASWLRRTWQFFRGVEGRRGSALEVHSGVDSAQFLEVPWFQLHVGQPRHTTHLSLSQRRALAKVCLALSQ